MRKLLLLLFSLSVLACNSEKQNPSAQAQPTESTSIAKQVFQKLSSDETGIDFENEIKEDYNYNILNFEYLYNGGGVSIGDINNDGLADVYFSATFAPNKLYLNKGNMKFEEISEEAGVSAKIGFKTGVTMADINADGWLDIMVCRTSKEDDGNKDNLVFINNGDLTFTEKAKELGLNDNSNSNHANFFDYDLDGDLDMYLLNHRLGFKDAVKLDLQQNTDGTITRKTDPKTPFESDRLYRNDGGRFIDVSKQAGIFNSSFGLSATISDLNNDGFPDVYVGNDYIEPDYVYINNGDGTFTDRYDSYVGHSSQNSMGCDIADFNNDGLLDFMVLDMIAEDHVRYKELMNVMQFERYETLLKYGYGHQVGRNVLQLNNGNGTFSELGQLAGVSNTDWSWSTFFADFDNDGFKDLFVTNGYRRDVTNLDYMNYTRDSIEQIGGVTSKRYPDINDFLKNIPEEKLQNYVFRNNGDLTFSHVNNEWGILDYTFSNGAAYGDLDNDGDIDIIVNNIDDEASVYQNRASGNFLRIAFEGYKKNANGIGAKVRVTHEDGSYQYQELYANRGFFSSSQNVLHFGLGDHQVESIEVKWPDGKFQTIKNPKLNSQLNLMYKDSGEGDFPKNNEKGIFKNQSSSIVFDHSENNFIDFNRNRLLPHRLSRFGPCIAVGDVNGDKLEDIYVGNAAGSPSTLFLQGAKGFVNSNSSVFLEDKIYEDTDAIFFDADNDGDNDLYVVSGGNMASPKARNYEDRFYRNEGGIFKKSRLPNVVTAGSCAAAHDIDQDGDLDLVVGGRHVPGNYPLKSKTTVLQNDGKGNFIDFTNSANSSFLELGMVTDLEFQDVTGDGKKELILVGEWMTPRIFKVAKGEFQEITAKSGLDKSKGWWNAIEFADLDKDGDLDFVAGNLGFNSRIKASDQNPIGIYARDFDDNDALEAIMTYSVDGKSYPFPGLDALVKQVPKVKKEYKRYGRYARATVEDIFGKEVIKSSYSLLANQLETSVFINDGQGVFTIKKLPAMAQISQVHDIVIDDFNADSNMDILLVGNDHGAETETGIFDASNGELFLGNAKGEFTFKPNRESGLWLKGEVREAQKIDLRNGEKAVIVGVNNGPCQMYSW